MAARLFGGFLEICALGAMVAVSGRVRRSCGTTRANLADLMRAGDPALLADGLARLGRTIDLSRVRQVRAAIGNLRGVSVHRAQTGAEGDAVFTRYEFPTGDIVYNPELGSQYVLLVALHSCVSAQLIRERLRGPEFAQPASRIEIAIYTDVPYADRPLSAFTYHENGPNCIRNFGLAQWKHDPWHNH